METLQLFQTRRIFFCLLALCVLSAYSNQSPQALRFDEASQAFEPFPDTCSAFSTVTTEPGKYSYDDLVAASDIIGAYIPKIYDDEAMAQSRALFAANSAFNGEIIQSSIDSKNKVVVVWLEDISKENIAAFRKEIYNAPFLIFMQAPEAGPCRENEQKGA